MRENRLKFGDFFETAGTFGHVSELMEFLGTLCLNKSALFEGAVAVNGCASRRLFICPGFHGNDSTRTTQCILVVDENASFFNNVTYGGFHGVVFAFASACGRHGDGGNVQGEIIIGLKGLTGIELSGQGRKIRVKTRRTVLNFLHGVLRGLEAVLGGGEGVRLQREVNTVVRLQRLGSDGGVHGTVHGFYEFSTQIVVGCGVSTLGETGTKACFVDHVAPTAGQLCRLKVKIKKRT